MTATVHDLPPSPAPLLPMTTYLIANDVPKEYRTAACGAFALWLEQLGDGNAPLVALRAVEENEALRAELAARPVIDTDYDDAFRAGWDAAERIYGIGGAS